MTEKLQFGAFGFLAQEARSCSSSGSCKPNTLLLRLEKKAREAEAVLNNTHKKPNKPPADLRTKRALTLLTSTYSRLEVVNRPLFHLFSYICDQSMVEWGHLLVQVI